MPFTLSDREAFIQKMDHSFSETLRMRKVSFTSFNLKLTSTKRK